MLETGTGRMVKVRLCPEKVLRATMYGVDPRRGLQALDLLPRIVRERRDELGLPDFDDAELEPTLRGSREAKLKLLKGGGVVAEFLVEFPATGRLAGAIRAWKKRGKWDLLLVVFVRAMRDWWNSEWFMAVVIVPSFLRAIDSRVLDEAVREMLARRGKKEGYEAVWPEDAREVAAALRDYEIIKRLEEITGLERTLGNWEEVLSLLERLADGLERIIEKLDEIVGLLKKLVEKE